MVEEKQAEETLKVIQASCSLELHRQLRIRAASDGSNISEVIVKALEAYLKPVSQSQGSSK